MRRIAIARRMLRALRGVQCNQRGRMHRWGARSIEPPWMGQEHIRQLRSSAAPRLLLELTDAECSPSLKAIAL